MQVRVHNLQKRYGQATVLNLPELHIDSGVSFGLVGNNGAGKTTFLRLILDLIRPSEGHVLLNGQDVAENDAWKHCTSSYLDSSFLIDYLTPVEYIHFVGSLYGLNSVQVEEQWARYRPFFGDQPLGSGAYIRDLSVGNQKKVGIVAALMVQPQLLVLDEPFANLDPTSRSRLKNMLKARDQSADTTLIISSHDLDQITEICRRIALIEHGVIVRDIHTAPDTLQDLESYFAVEEA